MLHPSAGFHGPLRTDGNQPEKNKDETTLNNTNCRQLFINKDDSEHPDNKSSTVGKWVCDKKRPDTEPYNMNLRKCQNDKDRSLPKELIELFGPLKCNLCNCTMGSTSTAKDHYEGKKHVSNIKKWLLGHPEYGEKYWIPEISQPKIIDPERLYCKYCDVTMSSEQQAQSHYTGKKHQNMINNGIMKNSYFNPNTGQWERCNPIADNRFGIGVMFLAPEDRPKEIFSGPKLFCDICNVACPSQVTFNDHVTGSRHKKRMLLIHVKESSVTKHNVVEDCTKKTQSVNDLSIYRTPSGKYYCHSCDVKMNSPIQFLQHCESKKHRYKSSVAASKTYK